MWLVVAILRCLSVQHTLVQDGFEAVKFSARQVAVLTDDHAAHRLPPTGMLAARLAVIQREARFERDAADSSPDASAGLGQMRAAGQNQIIGITRVVRAQHMRQAIQPKIEPKGAQVG